jgi:phage terminase large subunit-like protein
MRAPDELAAEAEGYVEGVLAGAVVVGRLVRLAVERHRRDLAAAERGERRLRFNRTRALRALWWIEARLRFSKGEWAGRDMRLSPWQTFIVWCVFGWEREVDGRWQRRFRTVYLSVARKNGKTELSAAILLVMFLLTGEREIGGECYFAATTEAQAAIGWKAAAAMVKRSPLLKAEVKVHAAAHTLTHVDTDSLARAVAADAGTLDGLGPLCAVVDEFHAHPDGAVFDVLESGMGARREPLMLVPTTAGGKRAGACWDLESDAIKALEGIGEAEGAADDIFGFIARLDDGDDPFNEAVWRKANPNMGVSAHAEKLRIAAKVAKRRTSALNEYLRKHMNLWTETSTAWLPMDEWDACAGDDAPKAGEDVAAWWRALEERLRGRRCVVGIDLSAVADYTAGVALFEPTEDDPFWRVLPRFWVPLDTVTERSRTDRVPVLAWAESGLIHPTDGNVVDQDAVKAWLLNLRERYDVGEIPMDPHNATKLQTELMALKFTVVSMRQGWVTMSPAIKQTEVLVRRRELRHGGHPVLRWMFANVALKRDGNDNLSLNKGRSGDRIDGIVSLVMAVGRGQAQGRRGSVYDEREPMVLTVNGDQQGLPAAPAAATDAGADEPRPWWEAEQRAGEPEAGA